MQNLKLLLLLAWPQERLNRPEFRTRLGATLAARHILRRATTEQNAAHLLRVLKLQSQELAFKDARKRNWHSSQPSRMLINAHQCSSPTTALNHCSNDAQTATLDAALGPPSKTRGASGAQRIPHISSALISAIPAIFTVQKGAKRATTLASSRQRSDRFTDDQSLPSQCHSPEPSQAKTCSSEAAQLR